MGVFNTFYLLFKSNSADAIKGNKEIERTATKAGEATKKTNEESTKLGKSYVNAVEDATRALAAYLSYQGIKSGIINAQEQNRTLSVQAGLWGQNTTQVAAYGAAVKAAGGSAEELVGWYDQMYKQNAAVGLPTKPLTELLDQIHDQVKDLPAEQQQFFFDKYGISGVGTRTLLSKNDKDYEEAKAEGFKGTAAMQPASEAAKKFGTAMDKLSTSFTNFWNVIGEMILPALTPIIDGLTDFFNYLATHKDAAAAFFTAMVVGATAFSLAAPAMIAGITGLGASAITAAPALAGLGLALGKLFAILFLAYEDFKGIQAIFDPSKGGDSMIAQAAHKFAGWIDPDVAMMYGEDKKPSIPSTPNQPNKNDYMSLLIAKGYSRPQAAAIAANLQAESGKKGSMAVGDSGLAKGALQWHPDRRADIKRGTGIDVFGASKSQTVDALDWEIKNSGRKGWSYEKFKSMNDANQAAGYFSQKFVSPRDKYGESMKRGQMAMQIAGETPFASQGENKNSGGNTKNVTVQIDKIEVQTQATDAHGITASMSEEFKKQMRQVFAQNNDAVAY